MRVFVCPASALALGFVVGSGLSPSLSLDLLPVFGVIFIVFGARMFLAARPPRPARKLGLAR